MNRFALPTAAETKELMATKRKETEEKAYLLLEKNLGQTLRSGRIAGCVTTDTDQRLDEEMIANITSRFQNNLYELGFTVKKFEIAKSTVYRNYGVYSVDFVLDV